MKFLVTAVLLLVNSYTCVAKAVPDQDEASANLIEQEPLQAPTNFRVTQIVASDKALFAWDPIPLDSVRGDLKGYTVKTWSKFSPTSHREFKIQGNVQTALVLNLVPFEKNYAQIYVYNSEYNGPPSETVSFDMPEGVPDAVSAFDAIPMGSTAFYLNWKKPENSNGILTGYNIKFGILNGTKLLDEYISRIPQITDPNQLHAKLSGLYPNARYRLAITAKTSSGESSRFVIDRETIIIEPTVPSIPDFTWEQMADERSTLKIKVTWLPNFKGNPGNIFYVEFKKKNEENQVTKTSSEYMEDYIVIEGLAYDVLYEFVVVAVDGNFETKSAPQDVSVEN